jgi:lysyl-tRNA synthetase class 2
LTTSEPDYPYRFDRTASVAEVRERFGSLDAGGESDTNVALAGRIKTTRPHGKLAFADVQDATDRIQLFAQAAVLGESGMKAFLGLGVGDIVGAEGTVMKTRRGELSIKVTRVSLLAKCLRSMPEKWHGMSDVETRHRQRYLDLLVNPGARRAVEARAAANNVVRSFMETRGFVEVETPLLQPLPGGAMARPFVTHHNALDIDLFLRIAPELYLKRLLIGGLERVYELNRSFRNEGVSTKYNPEFTMLEAYEAYVDYEDIMALVEELVRAVARAVNATTEVRIGELTVDLDEPFRRMTMFDAIQEATGRALGELWERRDDDGLREMAAELGVRIEPGWTRGKVVAEIFESASEPGLLAPTFVTGYPKEVSPLAKDHRSIEGFTEHADLIMGGVELAPCYSELNDPAEQRRRFEQQAAARAAGDEEAAPADEDFLEALAHAMPPAGGFGLGIDRLLVLLLEAPSIREVILFPTLRPQARRT